MTFGFARSAAAFSAASTDSVARLSRMLEPAEWASAEIPLLRNPREVVSGLYVRHLPAPSTVVVAVLDPEERVIASASFIPPAGPPDGWEYRNALLTRLRRVIPHGLRHRSPVRTAVLLHCRDGDDRWTEEAGAWMWGLRDACTLHGLRCGAYITLTRSGWQVLGEGRGGRRPYAGSRPVRPGWFEQDETPAASAAPISSNGSPTQGGAGAARAPRRTAGGSQGALRRTAAR